MGGFIRFIKKQHFWLIVPLLILIMAAAWFLAASDQGAGKCGLPGCRADGHQSRGFHPQADR